MTMRAKYADLWQWECEYVTEHLNLRNYTPCPDENASSLCSTADERIFPSIESRGSEIIINFGIDVTDRSYPNGDPIPNGEMGLTDMLPIAFEASYR